MPLDSSVSLFLRGQVGRTAKTHQDSDEPAPANAQRISVSAVSPAFNSLFAEIEDELECVRKAGEEGFRTDDMAAVEDATQESKEIAAFRARAAQLSEDWSRLRRRSAPSHRSDGEEEPQKLNKRLPSGVRTPESDFFQPILQTLVEMGGRGETRAVLDGVGSKMSSVLRPIDQEQLGSGTAVRWRNTAQFACVSLMKQGLLNPHSPHGVWEITDQGRAQVNEANNKQGALKPDSFSGVSVDADRAKPQVNESNDLQI